MRRKPLLIVGLCLGVFFLFFFFVPILAAQYPANYVTNCVTGGNATSCLPTYKYLSLSCGVFSIGAEYYTNGQYVPLSGCFQCIIHTPTGCYAYDRLTITQDWAVG
jgi:hypothetical protein